uniref:Uncharacterized protein n=1 Tax=Oryza sativa subsp. japonica TaxID=39947 RepID=Q8H5K7_ORYSJ|nr:hypothetical protein [Oryza sativa Japonica Group]
MSAYPLFPPLLVSLTLFSQGGGKGAEATPVPHGLSRPSSHAASAAGEGSERGRRGRSRARLSGVEQCTAGGVELGACGSHRGRSWVAAAAGEGRRGRPSPRFSPSPLPHRLGVEEAREAGERGGRRRRRGQRRWRRGGRRRAGELEGVDGDVVAVVELDGAEQGTVVGGKAMRARWGGAWCGLGAAVGGAGRRRRGRVGAEGLPAGPAGSPAHPPLRAVGAGPASPHRPPHIHSPPRRRRGARGRVRASRGELGRDGAAGDDDDAVAARLADRAAGGGSGPRPTGLAQRPPPLLSASLRRPRR